MSAVALPCPYLGEAVANELGQALQQLGALLHVARRQETILQFPIHRVDCLSAAGAGAAPASDTASRPALCAAAAGFPIMVLEPGIALRCTSSCRQTPAESRTTPNHCARLSRGDRGSEERAGQTGTGTYGWVPWLRQGFVSSTPVSPVELPNRSSTRYGASSLFRPPVSSGHVGPPASLKVFPLLWHSHACTWSPATTSTRSPTPSW